MGTPVSSGTVADFDTAAWHRLAIRVAGAGSGMDIAGVNDGSARLNVRVDGELIGTDVPARVSTNFQQTFDLRGLAPGRHTVTIEVVSGTLLVDAVGVIR